MTNEYYELDELLKTFDQHEKESIIENQRITEEFKKNYPKDALPTHFNNDFSLPKALKTIVNKIIEIKDKQVNIDNEYEIHLDSMLNSFCVLDKVVSDLYARVNTLENENE